MSTKTNEKTRPLSQRAMEAAGNAPPASSVPATTQQAHRAPAHLQEYAETDAGKGTSQSPEDNLVPLIYVLQPLSPQVNERDDRYIEGAKPGDLWLRNAPKGMEIVKGAVGCVVQPCYFYRDVVEWVPRDEGGGFVGRHAYERARDVPGAVQDPDDPNHWTTADGDHDLVETRNHAVRVFAPDGRVLPFLLPFTSTGHSVSRAWMSRMNDKLVESGPAKGKPYPSYAHLYRLTTEQRSNTQGKWFGIVAEDVPDDQGGWATTEEYLNGRRLHEQFAAGEKRAEAPVDSGGATETAGTAAKKKRAAEVI